MKSSITTALFLLFWLQFTVLLAKVQESSDRVSKCYFDREMLDFSSDGIIIHSAQGTPIPLSLIHHDGKGYYVEGRLGRLFPLRAQVIASCRVCGAQYVNRFPQPCEHCKQTGGFNIEYIDDGY